MTIFYMLHLSPATRILNENPPFFIFCTKERAPYKFIECTTVVSSFFIIRQVKPKPGKNTSLKKFHSQYYVNGSECDLTGKARETQIKVFCIMTLLTQYQYTYSPDRSPYIS